jgi:hypothetical protein
MGARRNISLRPSTSSTPSSSTAAMSSMSRCWPAGAVAKTSLLVAFCGVTGPAAVPHHGIPITSTCVYSFCFFDAYHPCPHTPRARGPQAGCSYSPRLRSQASRPAAPQRHSLIAPALRLCLPIYRPVANQRRLASVVNSNLVAFTTVWPVCSRCPVVLALPRHTVLRPAGPGRDRFWIQAAYFCIARDPPAGLTRAFRPSSGSIAACWTPAQRTNSSTPISTRLHRHFPCRPSSTVSSDPPGAATWHPHLRHNPEPRNHYHAP